MPKNSNCLRQEVRYIFAIIFLQAKEKEVTIMTLYADVCFFINFAFDAEILVLLCRIYSKKVPKLRLMIASLVGGLVSVFPFIPYFEILSRPPARFIIPVFMVGMVFAPINFKAFLSRYLSFVAISFIMSGAINFLGLSGFAGIFIPLPIYLLLCILRKNIYKRKGEVILEYQDKKTTADGFFDSGNMLLSGGLPVILGNDKIFEKLLGCRMADENLASFGRKFDARIVPFVSLGRAGTVMGVKLTRIWVNGKEYNDVVLAYAGKAFSDELILNSIMT